MMDTMANVGSVTTLPVVDLRADPDRLREGLREAAHEVGFFYLTGHGVSQALVARVLDAARRLFALPDADKDAIAMVRSRHFRGYTRLGGELTRGEVDWREQIDVGPERPPIGGPGRPDYLWLQGPNQWPAALPELPGIIAEWDAALSEVVAHPAAALGGVAGQPAGGVRRGFRRGTRDADQDRAVSGPRRQPPGRRRAQGLRGAHAAAGRAG